ncbi:MAG TPA: MarR family winged helix-turn-helix transcriptional regulator, partial [Longimicrobiales bacterium]
MAQTDMARRVEAIRHFNRFYTRQIGLLQEGLLRSPFTLTEARVMYELAQREEPTAAELGRALGLDAGYLSRILRGFRKRGLIERRRSPRDGRRHLLALTDRGREAFAALDAASSAEVEGLLRGVAEAEADRL